MSRLTGLGAVFILAYLTISPDRFFAMLPSYVLDTQHRIDVPLTSAACENCQLVPETIVFTGDLMLARHVERLAIRNGDRYSFGDFSSFLNRSDVVVTNFEASIPVNHVSTPDFTMRFSVPYRLAALLPEYNIQYASLANNHAYDFGTGGYSNTIAQLGQAGITAFGHPSRVDDTSIAYVELKDTTVAVVGIHTLYRQPTADEMNRVFAEAANNSDWQVAYVHWGNEYELMHNSSQRVLAERLVAAGADVVIGHHPHVIQDIGVIAGVPVFYSLGNFIFDQYFSDDVQEGLLVRLRFSEKDISYELLPVTSKYSVARPQLMTESESRRLLAQVRGRSNISISEQLLVGLQPVFGLATSTQISIMTE